MLAGDLVVLEQEIAPLLAPDDEPACVLGAADASEQADDGSEKGFGLDGTAAGSGAGDRGFEDDGRLAGGPTGGAR